MYFRLCQLLPAAVLPTNELSLWVQHRRQYFIRKRPAILPKFNILEIKKHPAAMEATGRFWS